MAELTEEKVQEMLQQSERRLSQKMEDLEALLVKSARGDKYQADTLDLLLSRQTTLQNTLSEFPQGMRKMLSTSISKIIQDEVTKALAVQIPKIIQAVQQQFKRPGERYADDEEVEKPVPPGFKKRLQSIQEAVQSGAQTKKDIFQTESGTMCTTPDGRLVRLDRHEDGSASYDTIVRDGVGHVQHEDGHAVKETSYINGVFSHKIVGHRANIIDKLDETCSTLEEKKEAVREYREKHPRGGR